jgi:hypothetical protein
VLIYAEISKTEDFFFSDKILICQEYGSRVGSWKPETEIRDFDQQTNEGV